MGRKTQVFAQPFSDIWQYSPFPPSAEVAQFLQQFTQAGRFDAERFWASVSAAGCSAQSPQTMRHQTWKPGNNGISLRA
jgi:hypothetical protein